MVRNFYDIRLCLSKYFACYPFGFFIFLPSKQSGKDEIKKIHNNTLFGLTAYLSGHMLIKKKTRSGILKMLISATL